MYAHYATVAVLCNSKLYVFLDQVMLSEPAGQERFRSITPKFYHNVDAVILVYSIDSKYTFESLPTLINDVQDHTDETTVWVLFGNKCDLKMEIDKIEERTQDLSEQIKGNNGRGINIHSALSAKTGENVTESLDKIVMEMCKRESSKGRKKQGKTVKVSQGTRQAQYERHCC